MCSWERRGWRFLELALGTWSFGGDWGPFDQGEARSTIRRAVESGITLFDTAQAYGFGVSERLLGDTLWQVAGREDVVVATKGGLRMDGNRLVRDASPEWLTAGVEASLRNLRTDYIDLYQVHWPDLHTPAEETAAALQRLVRPGRSDTSACPTTTSTRWTSSAATARWRPSSRPTTCSDANRRRDPALQRRTASRSWSTGRWHMACWPAA